MENYNLLGVVGIVLTLVAGVIPMIDKKYRFMNSDDYQNYLQSGHWQEYRRAAIQRAGYRCQVCNKNTIHLEVHHRTYENLGNEHEMDTIVLCDSCHAIFHEFGKLEY